MEKLQYVIKWAKVSDSVDVTYLDRRGWENTLRISVDCHAESVEDAREKYAVETPTIFNARASNQTHKHDIVFNTLPIEISESTCVVVGK